MAKRTKTKPKAQRPRRRVRRAARRLLLAVILVALGAVAIYSVIDPPITPYIASERMRYGGVEREWVDLEDISPNALRAVIAAEDVNFCLHWGLDLAAIRAALADGSGRGGSTISQQVVKNVYLWQGRSWVRKTIEALLTPGVEIFWSKPRILEVYLNVAEFDRGVFGIEAASQRYFGVPASALTPTQAARLAMVLPNPKDRSALDPSRDQRARAARILDGARTIEGTRRDACIAY